MELIEIFETLVKIPSPSLSEDKVADKIIEILNTNNIEAKKDKTGNVMAKIKGNNPLKKPIILSAHMDVVGDDSPINIVHNGNIIETDKKRTLGADDKAGVASAIKLALEVNKLNIDNGGLELIFTRDEEQSMVGINGVEFEAFEGEDILVLDSDKLGNFEISGAGYTKLAVEVLAPKGGHSGLDIGDSSRVNAAKLTAELANLIPQGVYKQNDELGVITSINLGSIVAGAVDNSIYRAVDEKIERSKAAKFVCHNSMSNLINTTGYIHYSIRSSNKNFENELIAEIQNIINKFNEKYKGLAEAKINVECRLPIFEKADNEKAIEIAKKAAMASDINLTVRSFHAGAETHIYANKFNQNNVKFRPVLVGIADIFNMHSYDEKIDVETYKKGYNFIKNFFIEYNKWK